MTHFSAVWAASNCFTTGHTASLPLVSRSSLSFPIHLSSPSPLTCRHLCFATLSNCFHVNPAQPSLFIRPIFSLLLSFRQHSQLMARNPALIWHNKPLWNWTQPPPPQVLFFSFSSSYYKRHKANSNCSTEIDAKKLFSGKQTWHDVPCVLSLLLLYKYALSYKCAGFFIKYMQVVILFYFPTGPFINRLRQCTKGAVPPQSTLEVEDLPTTYPQQGCSKVTKCRDGRSRVGEASDKTAQASDVIRTDSHLPKCFGKSCGRSSRVIALFQSVIKLEDGWEGSAKDLVDISYRLVDISSASVFTEEVTATQQPQIIFTHRRDTLNHRDAVTQEPLLPYHYSTSTKHNCWKMVILLDVQVWGHFVFPHPRIIPTGIKYLTGHCYSATAAGARGNTARGSL